MEIHYTTLSTESEFSGTIVVIDVLRAFTTAAYAFAAGAERIIPIGTPEETLARRAAHPGSLAMGEVGGAIVPGFDYGNSPQPFVHVDLHGKTLYQRTGAGVQGLLRCPPGAAALAASFVVAGATVRRLLELKPETVTMLVTGHLEDRDGDEDRACADYLAARLRGESPDPAPYFDRVRQSTAGRLFQIDSPAHPTADLPFCLQLDRFDFAMQTRCEGGELVLKKCYTGRND
ncbi:MAG: 2-phosphosulfolactate phosphatase [Anaerolineaceae bacterium]